MPNNEPRVRVALRMHPILLDDIDAIAERENRSRSNLMETMLALAVSSYPADGGKRA